MKINLKFYPLLFAGLLLSFLQNCVMETTKEAPVITITTTNFTGTTIACEGKLISGNSSEFSAYGVCWSTKPFPTIADHIIIAESNSGSFTVTIPELSPGITYYIRSFISRNDETIYSSQIIIATSTILPVITTIPPTFVTPLSAKSGGNIISDGGAAITSCGVCWSTSHNPTTANSKSTDSAVEGSFTSSITGLAKSTTYYLRAYATNSAGTSYGDELMLRTEGETEGEGETVSDIDGNVYHTVKICNQVWMVENLKTTKYSDGTPIPQVTDQTAWNALSETDKAYCYYNNNASKEGDTYGVLYTWPAAMNGKTYSIANPSGVQGACPVGWHIPSYAEWDEITKCLGGQLVAGGPMKEAGTLHWNSPNKDATNSSGFTALPGGYRNEDGAFRDLRSSGMWWSTTENCMPCYPGDWWTHKEWGAFYHGGANNPDKGLSVRCVKD